MRKINAKLCAALILIIFLAFFLRFYKVTEIPVALNWDEVSIGYNAYSVLKTGRDEWGVFLPINFRAYGEYKLPAQIYASIPGIAIFGLNEMGVRITPVIYGALTVLLLFFLARALFQNNFIGLGSSFLLAVSPWHIQLTRASFESSFAVFWIVLGIWLLVEGFKKKKLLFLSMLPFAISMYTYNSARVFTPIFLAVTFLIFYKYTLKNLKTVILAALIFTALLLPLVPYYLEGKGDARYKLVSVTDDPGLLPRINQNRGNSQLPEPLPRLVHNRITYLSFYIAGNYLSHFTPQFLFISGAPHKQHHVQNMGELYLFQAPFLLLGLYLLFKKKNQFRWLIISWVLLAFVPVSVTNDSIPHALRTLIAVPTYQLITALGAYYFFLWVSRKRKGFILPAVFILTITILISLSYYLYNYYEIYPKLYSRDWQYGYRQVVDYIDDHKDQYDEIVFTRHYGEPHMFTLFYQKYDPYKFQTNSNLIRFETFDWVRVLKFDKFYFPDLGDKGTRYEDIVAQNPGKKMLFIGKPGDFPSSLPKLKTVNFLNGDLAFEIVEVK